MKESWSSVLLCFRYPVCVGDSIFRSSKNDISLLLITRSRSLPRLLRRLMGRLLSVSFLSLPFLWTGMMVGVFFHKAGTVPFFHDSLKSSSSVFLAAGPRCFDHVICNTIWSWCLLALQVFYCCFNVFHGDGLAHAVVWCWLLLQLC